MMRRRPLFVRRAGICRQLVLAVLGVGLATSVIAQPATPDDRARFLGSLNLQDDALTLRDALYSALLQTDTETSLEEHADRAELFAFFLVAHGVTTGEVLDLIDAGVDVLHAISTDERPLEEQSLLADLAVRAEVLEMRPDAEFEDGFYGTVLVRVLDTFKGVAPSDTLVVRQRARETPTSVGGTYLFLLSNRMYRFAVARRNADVPPDAQAARFSIYRQYPMVDGTLLWSGYTADDTEAALANIRVVDAVLRGDG